MLLKCVAVLVVCAQLTSGAYPIFGTKRYGRSVASWTPLPLAYYQPRATRPFAASPYYDGADLPEYYYPQDPYAYVPDKYPVYQSYQSLVPYYYSDQRRPYGYYGYDEVVEPVDDMQDEIMDEDREDREDTLPYGQETWYDNGHQQDNNAEANAVFLKNLILAQMYNDRYGGLQEDEDVQDRWVYGEPIKASMPKEDEDVRQLKSLTVGNQQEKKTRMDDIFSAQRHEEPRMKHRNDWTQYKRSGSSMDVHEMSFTDRKLRNPVTTTAPSAATPSTTLTPRQGQKEVVLPRPASPVRTPNFHKFVSTRSRGQPSVYDTIKKLLNMQEHLEKNGEGDSLLQQQKQKRSYIPSEESLVEQLGNLKKKA